MEESSLIRSVDMEFDELSRRNKDRELAIVAQEEFSLVAREEQKESLNEPK